MSEGTISKGSVGAKLESEKSKDIRSSNIIAAKGKTIRCFNIVSCSRCCENKSGTKRYGQNGTFIRFVISLDPRWKRRSSYHK